MSQKNTEIIVASTGLALDSTRQLPAAIQAPGNSARFAWDEFFRGHIRNRHTRDAYMRAVQKFLA